MPKLGVLVVHGMGSQDGQFHEGLRDELADRLGADWDEIAWESVHWSPVVKPLQDSLWNRLKQGGPDLDWVRTRKFFLHYFADALAYQKGGYGSSSSSTYHEIQKVVHAALQALHSKLEADKPIVVIAHSLGGYVMTSHIWDRQTAAGATDPLGGTAFERFETLSGMVTFGCNLPMFAFAHSPAKTIQFPGNDLSPSQKAAAKWLNFYDADDVLGWPLKHVYAEPAATIAKIDDHEINVGLFGLTTWNPASHMGYWTDDDFTKPVAAYLKTILAA